MKYNDKQVKVSIANVDNFIKKNKRKPKTVKVGGDILPIATYLKLPQLVNAYNNIQAFKKKQGRLPNYVTICSYNLPKAQYSILFATIPTPTTPKTYKQGNYQPSIFKQDTNWYCMPNSVQLGLYYLTNKLISEKTLASWMGTVKNKGTDHNGGLTGIAKFNKTYKTNLKLTFKKWTDLGKTEQARYEALGKLMADQNKWVFIHMQYRYGEQNNGKGFGHYESPYKVDLTNKTITVYNSLSGGYYETRSWTKHTKYINAKNQPQICIISK